MLCVVPKSSGAQASSYQPFFSGIASVFKNLVNLLFNLALTIMLPADDAATVKTQSKVMPINTSPAGQSLDRGAEAADLFSVGSGKVGSP